MKKLFMVAFLVMPLAVEAGIRVGNKLVSEGDSPGKLIHALGSPVTKSFAQVWCDRKKKSLCTEEVWTYFYSKRIWEVTILNNEITDISWTRQ